MMIDDMKRKSVQFKLKDGLNIELIYAPTKQTYVQYDIPLGSIHQNYTYNGQVYHLKHGTAHFLEHMMYHMEDHDGFDYFHELGVMANALTTYRQTTYGVIGYQNMLEATIYLMHMLNTPLFPKSRIDAERAIIGEEIAMYEDQMDATIQKKMFEQLLHIHPILSDITGHKKDIESITSKDLYHAYHHFYKSSKRQLLIMGPIDIEDYKTRLMALDDLNSMPVDVKIQAIKEPYDIVLPNKIYTMPIEVAVLNMGIKLYIDSVDEAHLFKNEVSMLFLMRMLFGGSSSFHEDMVDLGLIDDGFNFNVILEDHTLIFMMDVETEDTDLLKTYCIDYLFNTHDIDLNETDFEIIKKAYIGHFMMALDDIENRLFLYGKYQLNGLSLTKAFELVKDLKFKDLLDLKDKIDEKHVSFSHFIEKLNN